MDIQKVFAHAELCTPARGDADEQPSLVDNDYVFFGKELKENVRKGKSQLRMKRLDSKNFELTIYHPDADVQTIMPELSWPIGYTFCVPIESDMEFNILTFFMRDTEESRELYAWLRQNS